jgi:signal transduction histidine kinase
LRRIPIRTKLALASALPLVALIVVTGVAVRATSDDSYDTLLLALAVVTVVAAAVLTWAITRSITEPLRSLTAQAKDMAERRLPEAVHDILETPLGEDVRPPAVDPVTVAARDEVGDVVEALNTVQETALDLAVEQAVLRRNIADSFVNLGRRNQNLLGRQLDFITELESHETDPETLASLFRLDHLATRMRRNAESLLVLAGIEPPRKWAAPVRLTDVIRAALGEVEDYHRVMIRTVEPATVLGSAAADLAHLIAELIENGLTFSPPDQVVEVSGAVAPRGYRLTVVDHGLGMNQGELERANLRLMGAESFTIAPSKYLGHYVAGNLAARHGVGLRLGNVRGTGVAAAVELPASVLTNDAPLGDPITDPNSRTVAPGTPPRPPTPTASPIGGPATLPASAVPPTPQVPPTPAAESPAGPGPHVVPAASPASPMPLGPPATSPVEPGPVAPLDPWPAAPVQPGPGVQPPAGTTARSPAGSPAAAVPTTALTPPTPAASPPPATAPAPAPGLVPPAARPQAAAAPFAVPPASPAPGVAPRPGIPPSAAPGGAAPVAGLRPVRLPEHGTVPPSPEAPDAIAAGGGPSDEPAAPGAGSAGRGGGRSLPPLPGGPATTPRLQPGRTASGLAKREPRRDAAGGDDPTLGGPDADVGPGRPDAARPAVAHDELLAGIARALPHLAPAARRRLPADESRPDPAP